MIKRFFLSSVFSMFVLVNLSYAETPFTETQIPPKEFKENKNTSQLKEEKLPNNVPPLPENIPSGQFSSFPLIRERIVIKGKVNNKVLITNSSGDILMVNDGDIIDGCLVSYPELVCDPKKIEKTKIIKKNKDLEKELLKKKEEINTLKKENENLKEKINSLIKEKDNIEKENKAKSVEIKNLKTENLVLSEKLQSLNTEKEMLLKRLQGLEEKFLAFEKENSKLNETNKKFGKKDLNTSQSSEEIDQHKKRGQKFLDVDKMLGNCKFLVRDIGKVLVCSAESSIAVISDTDTVEKMEKVLRYKNKRYFSEYRENLGILFLNDDQI